MSNPKIEVSAVPAAVEAPDSAIYFVVSSDKSGYTRQWTTQPDRIKMDFLFL